MNKITTHQLVDTLVLSLLIIFSAWYLYDSYSGSSHIMNLILVAPLACTIIVLCSFTLVKQLIKPTPVPEDLQPFKSVVPVMVLFAAYVLSLNWLGFDVGTFLFIGIFLWMYGEKRIHWLLAYSFVFSALVALFFSKILPYPMPMLILPTAY